MNGKNETQIVIRRPSHSFRIAFADPDGRYKTLVCKQCGKSYRHWDSVSEPVEACYMVCNNLSEKTRASVLLLLGVPSTVEVQNTECPQCQFPQDVPKDAEGMQCVRCKISSPLGMRVPY